MKSPLIEGGGKSFEEIAEPLGECLQEVVRYIENEQILYEPSRFFLYGEGYVVVPYGITVSTKTLSRGQVVQCLLFLPGNKCVKIDSDSLLSPWYTLEERIKTISEKEEPGAFSGWEVLETNKILGRSDIVLDSRDIMKAYLALKRIREGNEDLR